MTKGRTFAPSSANEGLWFRHRGEQGDPEGRLRAVTSTGNMLEAPFSAPVKPRVPPAPFTQKEDMDYKLSNRFTNHDNRHYFQECGEYFGNGKDSRFLGRRLHPIEHRLHHTDTSFLKHHGRNPTMHDYNPVTATSYRGVCETEPVSRRRFPRIYNPSEPSEPRTKTTAWCSSSDFRTPMNVLAISQEPFLQHNSWKYSFHGHHKVYPPYDRKKNPRVPNVLNRYGADFCSPPPALPAAGE